MAVRSGYHESVRTIRLLKAVAREGKHTMDTDEIPDYTMEEFPYPECPDYTGLSYVWGEENPGVSIRVNGKSVAIRSNLGQALARIATSDPGAYVWADAICINQQDDEEKSRLVQHMGQIFANAKLVYAWLGPNLDVLFDLFRRGDFPVEEYSAFSARPFWSRVWVLQEVYLAKNLYYLCGHCRLASRTLAGALILLETFQRRLIRSRGSLREQVTTNAPLAKFAFRLPSFPEMHRLVIYTSIYPLDVVSLRIAMTNFCVKELPSGSRATDPRDMIYGLLGFANEEERAYIRADYGKDVRESYVVATRRMIQNGFTDVLAWAQPERKRVAGLPSWVPDYSSTIYESLCSQGQAKAWLPRFRACGESDYSDQAARLDGPLVLPVHGRRLGVLLGVGAQDWFPRSHTRAAYPSSSSSSSSSSSAGAGEALLARAVPHERLLAFLTEIQDLGRRAQAITGRDDGATDLTWRVPCCDQIVMDSRLVRRDPSTKSRYEQTLEGLRACLREPGRELPSQSRPYVEALLRWVDKRPFLTASGLVGLGPARARAGDEVVALEGFSACYVLRRQDGLERNEFTLVGEAYVDGAMDGEMMGCSDSDSDSSEWFYLV
ncbi:HET-domain-containing protein [Xylaria intraflava]|nr:HET-domain-containing protein [Xylaria intraflava]